MKKLLSLLAMIAMVSSTAASEISCLLKIPPSMKLNISEINFHDVNLTGKYTNTGAALYDAIQVDIANYANTTLANIQQAADNLSIKIYQKDGKTLVNNTDDHIASGSYIIKIDVKQDDQWFNPTINTVIKTIGVNEQKDINNMSFNYVDLSSDGDGNAARLYDAIRSQIATYADASINANDIANDKDDFFLSIWNGSMPINDGDSHITSGNYTVKIDVKTSNPWFKSTPKWIAKSVAVNALANLKDINKMTFSNLNLTHNNSASVLFAEVWNQIAKYVNDLGAKITANDIKNDHNLVINIIKPDGKNELTNSSENIALGQYNIHIRVKPTDQWFNPTDKISKTIIVN